VKEMGESGVFTPSCAVLLISLPWVWMWHVELGRLGCWELWFDWGLFRWDRWVLPGGQTPPSLHSMGEWTWFKKKKK